MTTVTEPTLSHAVEVEHFRNGMALLTGAVTVITTGGPAGQAGFTASAVCSVTDTPPTVLVCMNRSSFAHPFFTINQVLCINVLSASQQAESALFANRAVTMGERFERCRHQSLATGAPALDDALVNLDGDIVATHDIGTHSVFIVRVKALRLHNEGVAREGLAYFDRRYHPLTAPLG